MKGFTAVLAVVLALTLMVAPLPAFAAPPSLSNLAAKIVPFPSPSGHAAVLVWTASTDGAANPTLGYNVYRGTVAGGESSTALNATPIAVGCSGATCTYTDPTILIGQAYFFTVKATLNGVLSIASNEASVGGVAPAPPTNLTGTSN
jgi:hypothetical protein